jgi:single-strand DNA-binding protein
MANLNKVMFIGRLTRDVETRAFGNGGMVSKFGFAVNNSKRNAQTGQWEDVPMYIDCEVYNRGDTGKLADLVRDRCRKGTQVYIEGKLHLDQWADKTTGQNRQKHKLVVDVVQFLEPRDPNSAGGGGDSGGYSRGGGSYSSPPMQDSGPDDMGGGEPENTGGGGGNGDIPF